MCVSGSVCRCTCIGRGACGGKDVGSSWRWSYRKLWAAQPGCLELSESPLHEFLTASHLSRPSLFHQQNWSLILVASDLQTPKYLCKKERCKFYLLLKVETHVTARLLKYLQYFLIPLRSEKSNFLLWHTLQSLPIILKTINPSIK